MNRYHIVSESDLTEAARKLDNAAGTISGTIHPQDAAKGAEAARK